jgi:hypothetical protein
VAVPAGTGDGGGWAGTTGRCCAALKRMQTCQP